MMILNPNMLRDGIIPIKGSIDLKKSNAITTKLQQKYKYKYKMNFDSQLKQYSGNNLLFGTELAGRIQRDDHGKLSPSSSRSLGSLDFSHSPLSQGKSSDFGGSVLDLSPKPSEARNRQRSVSDLTATPPRHANTAKIPTHLFSLHSPTKTDSRNDSTMRIPLPYSFPNHPSPTTSPKLLKALNNAEQEYRMLLRHSGARIGSNYGTSQFAGRQQKLKAPLSSLPSSITTSKMDNSSESGRPKRGRYDEPHDLSKLSPLKKRRFSNPVQRRLVDLELKRIQAQEQEAKQHEPQNNLPRRISMTAPNLLMKLKHSSRTNISDSGSSIGLSTPRSPQLAATSKNHLEMKQKYLKSADANLKATSQWSKPKVNRTKPAASSSNNWAGTQKMVFVTSGFPLPPLSNTGSAKEKSICSTGLIRNRVKANIDTFKDFNRDNSSKRFDLDKVPSLTSFGRKWDQMAKRNVHINEHKISKSEQDMLLRESFGRAITRRPDEYMSRKYRRC